MNNSSNIYLLNALTALKEGNLEVRLPIDHPGINREIAETFNSFAEQTSLLMAEVNRLMREIATEGRFGGQVDLNGLSGTWKKLKNNVNELEYTLTDQLREISETVELALHDGQFIPDEQRPQNEIHYLAENVNRLTRLLSNEGQPIN